MQLKTRFLQEAGEFVVFYEVDANKKPVANPNRIGLLSLQSSYSERKTKQIQFKYLGPLEIQKLSEVRGLGLSDLEAAIDELIGRDEGLRTEPFAENYLPIALLNFDENDMAIDYSLILFGDEIREVFDTRKKIVLNIIGNIELCNYEIMTSDPTLPQHVREELKRKFQQMQRELKSKREKRK